MPPTLIDTLVKIFLHLVTLNMVVGIAQVNHTAQEQER